MNQSVCNICGANYEYRNGRWICSGCGAYKPEELSAEVVTLLQSAAQKLRFADFDEAEKAYSDIIEQYPGNAEGYFGRLLAKYGIKYEDDFDGRKIPTCYATSIESVMTDKDYLRAIELADGEARKYYKLQAEYIERVRKEWIEKANKEDPYDIFISYKESNGIERTEDSVKVMELYNHLKDQGYRVFYSRESLRGKVGEKFEPYIFNALSTAKVMLVYGTSVDYIMSTWVKNEWHRYCKKMQSGEKAENSLLIACDNFAPSELPSFLSSRQCFVANSPSFYLDIDKCIAKLLKKQTKKANTRKSEQKFDVIHEHAYKVETVQPSCMSKGYLLHKCACGYEYRDRFKPLIDHEYKEVATLSPTCTVAGKKEYSCTMCGDKKYDEIPKVPHTFGAWIERIHPTCTKAGEKIRQCTECGYTEKQKINEFGHKFGQWQKNEQGIEVRHCSNCGHTETDKTAFLRKEERKRKAQLRLDQKNKRILEKKTHKDLKKARKLEKNGHKEEAMVIYYRYANFKNGLACFKVFEYEINHPNLYKHAIMFLEHAASAQYPPAQKLLAYLDREVFHPWNNTYAYPRYSDEKRDKVLIQFKAWKNRIGDGFCAWLPVIIFIAFLLFIFITGDIM